jgi:hypothetical protein
VTGPRLVKDFPAAQINRKWFGDSAEIPTDEGKAAPGLGLDAGSASAEVHPGRAPRRAAGLPLAALAIRGGQAPGVIFHTDRAANLGSRVVGSACQMMSPVN